MPITKATHAGAVRFRQERKQVGVELAQGGKGTLDASPAAFFSASVPVEDYRYIEIEDEIDSLISAAKRRLMWGHRLIRPEHPFIEITSRWENVGEGLDVKAAILDHKQRIALERVKERNKQRLVKEQLRYRPKTYESVPAVPRKPKPKNAVERREERIAALRKALAKESNGTGHHVV
jgi:hypothetical protein